MSNDTVKIAENEKYRLRIIQDDCDINPRDYDMLGTLVTWHGRYEFGGKKERKHGYDMDRFWYQLASEHLDETDLRPIVEELRSKIEIAYEEEYDSYSLEIDGSACEVGDYFDNYCSIDEAKEGIEDYLSVLCDTSPESIEKVAEIFGDNTIRDLLTEYIAILPVYLYDHSGLRMNVGGFNDPWDSGQVGYIFVSKADVINDGGNEETWLKSAVNTLIAEIEEYDKYLSGEVYGYKLEEKKNWKKIYEDGSEEIGYDWEEIDSCWNFIGIETIEDELKFGGGILKELAEKLEWA